MSRTRKASNIKSSLGYAVVRKLGAKKRILPFAFFAVAILLWEFSLPYLKVPSFLLPTPSDIYAAFVIAGWRLPEHVFVTFQEVIVGFAIGVLLGMLMGIGISYSQSLAGILYPLAITVKVVPIIAVAPLLIIWFGYGIWSKIATTVIISFFPLVVSTATGLRSVDMELIYLMNSLSATEHQVFFKVRLPWSMPHIFSALKIAITLSVIGAVVGEFVGSQKGLGYMLTLAMSFLDTPQLFVILIVLAALGISLFVMIVVIEKILAPWAVTHTVQT